MSSEGAGEGGVGGAGAADTGGANASGGSSTPTASGGSSTHAIEHGGSEGLELVVASTQLSCAEPYGLGGCDSWWMSMSVPPELAQPGTYPLAEFRGAGVFTNSSAEGPVTSDGSCEWTGVGYTEEGATITIAGIADVVRFVISGATLACERTCDPNGEHVAPRCR